MVVLSFAHRELLYTVLPQIHHGPLHLGSVYTLKIILITAESQNQLLENIQINVPTNTTTTFGFFVFFGSTHLVV